ncbi:MAG TPA: putative 2OG-Fe(II) oxygenase [Allosphingosinicella sp.]|jgi:tetratricopeptide (TPR) repeat protein
MLTWVNGPAPAARLAALRLTETASERQRGNPLLHLALGRALEQAGEIERAAETLASAHRRFPECDALKAPLASLLGRLGETDRGLAVAQGIADRRKRARLSLALLVQSRRFEEAAGFEEEVASADPFHPMLVECRIRRLRREPRATLALCEELLRRRAGDTRATYHKAIALAQLGRASEASALMGIGRYVHDGRLEAPAGYSAGLDFRAALAAELGGAPDLRPDPAGHATVDGLRTRVFPRAGDRASAELFDGLRSAVDAYAAALEGDHPFAAARPRRVSLKAWGLVFRSSGRQRVHCHPDRWATGVYYVAAPEAEGDGGSIRIGVLPDWAGIDPPWPVLTLKPEPGRLLIFPSFVPHDTVPTGAAGERIAVAFDVSPAD